jgi:hypothetical protein
MFEFTFACAALAGLGIDYFSRNDWKQSLRTFVASASVMTTVVLFTSVAYLFGARYFTFDSPLPAQSDSLTNPEIIIPLVFFASSLIALWNYARRRTMLSGALLVLVEAPGQFVQPAEGGLDSCAGRQGDPVEYCISSALATTRCTLSAYS